MDCRCPLKKTNYPDKPCHHGRRALDYARKDKKGGCPWFVNSLEANYCFFSYMKNDGGRPMETEDIAPLLLMGDDEVKGIVSAFKSAASEHLDVRPPAAAVPVI
jgi:hypothetical protein